MFDCVRSGYCCKKAPCVVGAVISDSNSACKYLEGDRPGKYSCGKYLEIIAIDPEYFGSGCSSSFNTDRKLLIRGR
jgi:hypothetical protein